MDLSLVTGAYASLKAAKEIGGALLDARDFTQSAAKIAEMNALLLKAQESLFVHNAQLMELQQQNFEASQELRKLKEALAERGRYTLFQITPGSFVYRANISPEGGDPDAPGSAEPEHYLCQPCYDKGVKSVLQDFRSIGRIELRCTLCQQRYSTGRTYPYRQSTRRFV